jgi:hypothetical protein
MCLLTLPRIVQQAIKLVRSLQSFGTRRYLWIDSYCGEYIEPIPLDPVDKYRQRSIVFGSAAMTIFLLNSDRLLRHEDRRQLEHLAQDVVNVEQKKSVKIKIQGSPKTRPSKQLAQREIDTYKWALKPQLLKYSTSTRLLFCFNGGHVFSCCESPNKRTLKKMGVLQLLDAHRSTIELDYEAPEPNPNLSVGKSNVEDSESDSGGELEDMRLRQSRRSSFFGLIKGQSRGKLT